MKAKQLIFIFVLPIFSFCQRKSSDIVMINVNEYGRKVIFEKISELDFKKCFVLLSFTRRTENDSYIDSIIGFKQNIVIPYAILNDLSDSVIQISESPFKNADNVLLKYDNLTVDNQEVISKVYPSFTLGGNKFRTFYDALRPLVKENIDFQEFPVLYESSYNDFIHYNIDEALENKNQLRNKILVVSYFGDSDFQPCIDNKIAKCIDFQANDNKVKMYYPTWVAIQIKHYISL